MGVRFPSVQSTTFVGPLPANANETVVITTPPFTPPLDNSIVLIVWTFVYTPQTGNSNSTFLIRRGTTVAGAQVNVQSRVFGLGSGNTVTMSGCYFDSPGAVSGIQYSLTIQQNGATAAGTPVDQCMFVFAL